MTNLVRPFFFVCDNSGMRPQQKRQAKRQGPRQVEIPENPTQEQKDALISRAMYTAMWHLERSRKTEGQIRTVLTRKAFTDEYIDVVIEKLKELLLLNDESYAEDFTKDRSRSKGRSAIKRDLAAKGVDRDLIDAALENVTDEDEETAARELAERKARSIPHNLEKSAKMNRLVGMLARRGFGGGISFRIAREALEAVEAEQEDDIS